MKLSSSSSSSSSSYEYTIIDDNNNDDDDNETPKRNLQTILQTAERAAYKAGKIMIQTYGDIDICDTKASKADLVTQSDIDCQRVIKDEIQNIFPYDYFLGEEDVDAGSFASCLALENALRSASASASTSTSASASASTSVEEEEDEKEDIEKLLWIVDPIDGTTNFQAGLPMFCVSIGIVSLKQSQQPEVIAGVIYNPILKEMVSAVRGRGCYLNGKRMIIRESNEENNNDDNDNDDDDNDDNDNDDNRNGISLDEALINVGFPIYSEGTLRVSSRAVTALATKVRGLRMIASASQVMSWVGQCKMNAYVSWDLNAWDVAAGMVIVEESGGFVRDFEGERATILTRDMIVSCNEGNSKHGLSSAILDVLIENDCLDYK